MWPRIALARLYDSRLGLLGDYLHATLVGMSDLWLFFGAFAGAFLGYFVAAWLDRRREKPERSLSMTFGGEKR
jgi:positive regulator of sigma E activity